MKSPYWYVFLIASLAFLNSCEQLPEPTATGKQTFGCRVNGKLWRPKGRSTPSGSYAPVSAYTVYNTSSNYLFISAFFGDQTIKLSVSQPKLTADTFPLNKPATFCGFSPNAFGAFATEGGMVCQNKSEFVTDSLHTGEIVITRLDPVAKIVSGRFSFVGYDPKTRQTIEVKDGRFDLNYRP